MLAVDEVYAAGLRGRPRKVQRVCEERGEAVPPTIVDFIKLARDGIAMKRINATLSRRETDLDTELVKLRSSERTIRDQITAVANWIKTLQRQLTKSLSAFEKLADDSSRTKVEHRAELIAVEDSLETEKAHVEAL